MSDEPRTKRLWDRLVAFVELHPAEKGYSCCRVKFRAGQVEGEVSAVSGPPRAGWLGERQCILRVIDASLIEIYRFFIPPHPEKLSEEEEALLQAAVDFLERGLADAPQLTEEKQTDSKACSWAQNLRIAAGRLRSAHPIP